MSIKKINILLVNFNSEKELLQCIKSLNESSYPAIQIFIIDNNSKRENLHSLKNSLAAFNAFSLTQEVLEHTDDAQLALKKIVLIENESNVGYAAANNIAIRYLCNHRKDEFVGILNPDLELEPQVVSDLVALASTPKVLAGNVFYDMEQRDRLVQMGGFRVKNWMHGVQPIMQENELSKLDAIHGSAIVTHVDSFRDIGLLPEDYFLYWEETDFCFKARSMGYDLKVNTASKIFDKGGTEQTHRFIPEYLYIFNGLKFYWKFKRFSFPFVLLSVVGKYIWAVLKGNTIRRRAVYTGLVDYLRLAFGGKLDVKKRIQKELNARID